jgi:hypothetical protein
VQLVQFSKRNQLGIIALICFAAAGAFFLAPGGSMTSAAIGGSLRLGLAFGVVWLALPNLIAIVQRAPVWYWYLFLLGLVLVAVRPMPFVFIVPPVLLVMWIFAPKLKQATERPPRRPSA